MSKTDAMSASSGPSFAETFGGERIASAAFLLSFHNWANSEWNSGSYASIATWKFVPPNPNAETPALLGNPFTGTGHSLASVGTKKGFFDQSTVLFGLLNPALGGIVRW